MLPSIFLYFIIPWIYVRYTVTWHSTIMLDENVLKAIRSICYLSFIVDLGV